MHTDKECVRQQNNVIILSVPADLQSTEINNVTTPRYSRSLALSQHTVDDIGSLVCALQLPTSLYSLKASEVWLIEDCSPTALWEPPPEGPIQIAEEVEDYHHHHQKKKKKKKKKTSYKTTLLIHCGNDIICHKTYYIINPCTNNGCSHASQLQSARTNSRLPFTPKQSSILSSLIIRRPRIHVFSRCVLYLFVCPLVECVSEWPLP